MTFRTIALLALGFVTVTGAQAMDRKKKDKKNPQPKPYSRCPPTASATPWALCRLPA